MTVSNISRGDLLPVLSDPTVLLPHNCANWRSLLLPLLTGGITKELYIHAADGAPALTACLRRSDAK